MQALGKLDGWRQIAAYLRRSEKWCREQACHPSNPLPVFRVGNGRGNVCASVEALVGWIERCEARGFRPVRTRGREPAGDAEPEVERRWRVGE